MAKTRNVTIEYHNTWIDISVPDNVEIFKYGTPDFPEITHHPNPEQAVRDALDNPIGIEKIPELVKGESKVTIAFDDWEDVLMLANFAFFFARTFTHHGNDSTFTESNRL